MLPTAYVLNPGRFRKGGCGVTLALCFLFPVTSQSQELGAAPDLDLLEKNLKRAMETEKFDTAESLVGQLGATGNPRAADIIIQNAFTGNNYGVEKAAGAAILSMKDPAVRARVLEAAQAAKNPKPRSRIILFSLVAKFAVDDPESLGVLCAGLEDPSKPVVLTVLKKLRELMKPESVPALIEALEVREKKGRDRIYFDIERNLKALTGVDLEFSADWRNYTAAHQGARPAPTRNPSGSATGVFKRPKFFSVSVDSDRVLFVIDVSESMLQVDPELKAPGPKEETTRSTGTTAVAKKKSPETRKSGPSTRERLTRVKVELISVINSLEPKTRFGLLSFSHELAWWGEGRGSLREASPGNKSDAVTWVRNLVASGATRTDLALEAALSIPDIDTILLLTDGAPRNEHNQPVDIGTILARTKETNRFLRCRIHTISFAQIVAKRMVKFVKELAVANDGVCTMLP